jgi:zinc protease
MMSMPLRAAFVSRERLDNAMAILMLALAFVTFPVVMSARAAVDIQEITTERGVKAWLVEDYTLPIVTVRFSFAGGSTQEPAELEGMTSLMTGLFDEGAGDLDSAAFQEAMDIAGGRMSFEPGRDALYGSLSMLVDDKPRVLELARLAINEPRFDAEPIERIRGQIIAGIRSRERDPQRLGREEFSRALYGEHPYARSGTGTAETVGAVTADDLRALHGRLFARSNLNVSIVGAIDAETAAREIDLLFGGLPEEADLMPVEKVEPRLDQEVAFDYPLPQASLQLVYPGIERDDPEFFGAFLMNHILGGGTFSSRLFTEVRELRGLAYGVSSGLSNSDYASALVIATSTRADRAEETLGVIRDQIARLVEEGPTEAELEAAKRFVIGAYPINNLDSSGAIARTLLELQRSELGIDYIERRVELIQSVTIDQVRQAAQRLLTTEPAILVIGPAADDPSDG